MKTVTVRRLSGRRTRVEFYGEIEIPPFGKFWVTRGVGDRSEPPMVVVVEPQTGSCVSYSYGGAARRNAERAARAALRRVGLRRFRAAVRAVLKNHGELKQPKTSAARTAV